MTLYEDLYYGRYYSSRLPSVRLAGRAAGSGESALQEKERNACSFLQPAAAHRWSQQPNSVTQPGQKQAQMVGHCCLHPPLRMQMKKKNLLPFFLQHNHDKNKKKKSSSAQDLYTVIRMYSSTVYSCTAVPAYCCTPGSHTQNSNKQIQTNQTKP